MLLWKDIKNIMVENELKEYEEICPRCGGTGIEIKEIYHVKQDFGCIKCDGTGKIDWLEKMFGKRTKLSQIEKYFDRIIKSVRTVPVITAEQRRKNEP